MAGDEDGATAEKQRKKKSEQSYEEEDEEDQEIKKKQGMHKKGVRKDLPSDFSLHPFFTSPPLTFSPLLFPTILQMKMRRRMKM